MLKWMLLVFVLLQEYRVHSEHLHQETSLTQGASEANSLETSLTEGKETEGQETEGKETEGQETEGKETEGQETEGKETEGQESSETQADPQATPRNRRQFGFTGFPYLPRLLEPLGYPTYREPLEYTNYREPLEYPTYREPLQYTTYREADNNANWNSGQYPDVQSRRLAGDNRGKIGFQMSDSSNTGWGSGYNQPSYQPTYQISYQQPSIQSSNSGFAKPNLNSLFGTSSFLLPFSGASGSSSTNSNEDNSLNGPVGFGTAPAVSYPQAFLVRPVGPQSQVVSVRYPTFLNDIGAKVQQAMQGFGSNAGGLLSSLKLPAAQPVQVQPVGACCG